MKKLLILGGANLHCKLVRAAKEMGLYTIVTDYLIDSPAKKIADKSYMYDVNDIDGIVSMCKKEGVAGVLSTHLDPCQRPYYLICEQLGLPCYIDNWKQVFTLTDKSVFKECCSKYGVDIIPTYKVKAVKEGIIEPEYPVLVKPALSRGSRGQSICNSREELLRAIDKAENESGNGDALIEKYMGNSNDFSMTYFFVDGEAYLTRTMDRYLGSVELGLEKVCIGGLSPSRYTDMYLDKVHPRIVNMLKELGIKNGPVFMQGFVDGDTVRFYDPGFRFPGSEYDMMFTNIWGTSRLKMLIEFAVSGKFSESYGTMENGMEKLKGHTVMVLFPIVGEGKIAEIQGVEEIRNLPEVECFTLRHNVGEIITFTGNVNQRFGEIDINTENILVLQKLITRIWDSLHVLDEDGREMLFGNLKAELLT